MKEDILLRKSLKCVIHSSTAMSAMDSFASGTIITGYALALGASNTEIGIISAIPFICNFMHLYSAYLLEKDKKAKNIAILYSLLSRIFYFFAALLVFFPQSSYLVTILISLLFLANIIGAVSGGAWIIWMKELIPPVITGRFMGTRLRYMTIAKVVCFSMATAILVFFEKIYSSKSLYPYFVLLVIAFICGIYSALSLYFVQNKKINIEEGTSFIKKIKISFSNRKFIHLTSIISYISFIFSFITPFITVFMVKGLKINMSIVVLMTLISQLFQALIIKKYGKKIDKIGIKKVLANAYIMLISGVIGMMLLPNIQFAEKYLIFFATICNILFGVASVIINLSIQFTQIRYTPKYLESVYISVLSGAKSIVAALASILGGIFIDKLNISDIEFYSLNAWQIFFICCILLTVIAKFFTRKLKRCF